MSLKHHLLVCAFLAVFNFFAGFKADTLIKTAQSHISIKQARVNDTVACLKTDETRTYKKITNTRVKRVQQSIVIFLENGDSITVTADQQLYLPQEGVFKKSSELKIGNQLLTNSGQYLAIRDLQLIQKEQDFFDISVDECHNFFVSHSEILVHNFVPLIAITLTTGGLAIKVPIITTIWGVVIGLIMHKRQKSIYRSHFQHESGFLQKEGSKQSDPNAGSTPPSKKPDLNNSNQNDPDKDDQGKQKPEIKECDAPHIFKNKKGHIPDTPENRKLLIDVASNENNFLGPDRNNSRWYGQNNVGGQ